MPHSRNTTTLPTLVIPSEFAAANSVEQQVLDEMGHRAYSEAAIFAVKLALEEALSNAIKHGNGRDRSKSIIFTFDVGGKCVKASIEDEGDGFVPADIPDPRSPENIEKCSGRGIMLMEAYMDEVVYNKKGNRVEMVKYNR